MLRFAFIALTIAYVSAGSTPIITTTVPPSTGENPLYPGWRTWLLDYGNG